MPKLQPPPSFADALERLRRKRGPLSNADIIETFVAVDFGTRIVVESATTTEPPASPVVGSMYIVPIGATGAWAGHEHTIAVRYEEGWTYITPRDGVIAIARDTDALYVANDEVWGQASGMTPAHADLSGLAADDHPQYLNEARGDARYATSGHNHDADYDAIGAADAAISAHVGAGDPHTEYIKKVNDRVGVNATADTTNRLYVKSDAVMFSHDDVTPGNGDIVHKLNKATSGDSAAVQYQVNGSPRARAGISGEDDYSIEVSPDGATWKDAIQIDKSTGVVTMPFTSLGGGGGGIAPNMVINGDFQINQRAFAGGALAAGAYGFDRWKAATGGASVSRSGYVVTLASGTIEQVVEPAVMAGAASLASTDVTISVEAPSADMTVTLGSASGTITGGSGRRSVTLATGAGDTGNLSLKIAKATAGSITFGRVKAEIGSTVTDWQARAVQVEMTLALFYYEKSYAAATAPGTATIAGSEQFAFNTSATVSHTTLTAAFKAPKRAAPTMTGYSTATGAAGNYRNGAAGVDAGVTIDNISTSGFRWAPSEAFASTNSPNVLLHWTADAEI